MKKTKLKSDVADVVETEVSDEKNTSGKTVDKVGSLLKEMRQQKGLRLPDVAKKLCIRRIYLEAIEESDYKEIPPIPYGIGFIRSYAEYLGLNSNNIVELYKEETNTNTNKGIYVLEPQSEATVPGRKYLLISLLAILFIYVLWQVFNKSQTAEEAVVENTVAEENNGEQEQPIVVEDYAVIPEETINTEKTADSEIINEQVTVTEESFEEPKVVAEAKETESKVLLKIKTETWVEVKNKDTLYISKVLQAGDEYVVPEGGKGMILSVGKVDGVDVYINGKIVPVAKVNKKTNIALDPFLVDNH